MPCFAKNIPVQRTKMYGWPSVEGNKDLPQKRTEHYVGGLSGVVRRFKTPSSRVSEYRQVKFHWDPHWAPNYKCSREAYCFAGKEKQWVIVALGNTAELNAKEAFRRFSAKWREEIGADSSLSNMFENINYLSVIALGRKVVPLILADLQREPVPWFTALQAITGENPVDAQSAGDFRKMAEAWLQWGRKRGLTNGQACP